MLQNVGGNLFVTTPPSPQNALDIFAGEWSAEFQSAWRNTANSNPTQRFNDPRLNWADAALRELSGSGFSGQRVLELNANQGAATCALTQLGAKEITAVEAKPRDYLKCLVVKEVYGLAATHFLLGDGLSFLKKTENLFDVVVAGGFIDQQLDPVEAISLLARRSRTIFLWSPVFDDASGGTQSGLRVKYGPPRARAFAGFAHTLYPRLEGTLAAGCWMRADEIVAALKHFGFTTVVRHDDSADSGKFVAVVGTKSRVDG